jgi:hypothetical protein
VNEEELYSESMYSAFYDLRQACQSKIDEIWSNFDQFDNEEQSLFAEMVAQLESAIFDFNRYFYAYDKYYQKKTLENTYRVIEGDTLVSIANKFYGNPTKWEDIYKANRLIDVDISTVATLLIPQV